MKSVAAVFDGKVFVPTEPVSWPERLAVTVVAAEPEKKMSREEAMEWLRSHPVFGSGADFDRGDLYP
jgi:predicted component of type VI protein secretion system